MTRTQQDLIDRELDENYRCYCNLCVNLRTERLRQDLELAYGCTMVAQVQAAMKRLVN